MTEQTAGLSAVAVADLVARRAVSPVEVMRASLERIEGVQAALNPFTAVFADEAMARARAAEAAVMAGAELPPLHGVPFVIKDFTPTRGKITTRGSRAYADWVPDADAVVVERLLAAGGIMVGKTTTPEFAYASVTESPLFGVTRNPWNPAHTSGGSSGGTAVAVATGCVPIGEGSDMGGSVRIPAAFCGIVGLKPSFGRIPMGIMPSLYDGMAHFGPLARTVADAALFLRVCQGPDDRDPQSLPPLADLAETPCVDLQGVRLALSVDLGYYLVDAEIIANTERAAAALREAGAIVEPVDLGWTRAINDAGYTMFAVYLAAYYGHLLERWKPALDPILAGFIEQGFTPKAVDLARCELVRTEQWRKLQAVFARYDALLCPTMPISAPRLPVSEFDYGQDDERGRYRGFDMTIPFNLVPQCPALSVPSGFTADGLPTGLQIVGRRFADDMVLRIGAALERVRPWTLLAADGVQQSTDRM